MVMALGVFKDCELGGKNGSFVLSIKAMVPGAQAFVVGKENNKMSVLAGISNNTEGFAEAL